MTKALINIFSLIFFGSFMPVIAENKDNDLYGYWFGFGIGSFGTLCAFQDDHLTKEDVISFKEGMLETISTNPANSKTSFQEAFYQAELLVKEEYPDCEI